MSSRCFVLHAVKFLVARRYFHYYYLQLEKGRRNTELLHSPLSQKHERPINPPVQVFCSNQSYFKIGPASWTRFAMRSSWECCDGGQLTRSTITCWPNVNQRMYNSWYIFARVNHLGSRSPTTYQVVLLVKRQFLLVRNL